MTYSLFKPFIIMILSGFITFSSAWADTTPQTINIHTDSLNDFNGLTSRHHNPALSVTANQLVFNDLTVPLNIEYLTNQRSMRQMDNGENICLVDRIKTPERAKKYLFSLPTDIYLNRRLYQNLQTPRIIDPQLFINDALDLTKFFSKHPDKRVLLSNQISYGQAIDKVLSSLPAKNKVYLDGAGYETAIAKLLVYERVNYALFYPQQIAEQNINKPLISYEIAGAPAFVAGRLMCTKSEEMREFLDLVNKTLIKLYHNKKLLNAHFEFIPNEYADILTKYFQQATESREGLSK